MQRYTSANRRFEGRCDHLYKTALIIILLPQSTSHVQQMMNGVDAIELAKKVYSWKKNLNHFKSQV